MDYRDRITIEPAKRSGKPCLRGLRITVYDVLDHLAGGMSEDEILADFPDKVWRLYDSRFRLHPKQWHTLPPITCTGTALKLRWISSQRRN